MKTPKPTRDTITPGITAALKRAATQARRRAKAYGTETLIAPAHSPKLLKARA